MVLEIAFYLKACAAYGSAVILLVTHERFLLSLVDNCDVLLKCVVLSEFLPTAGEAAGEFSPLHMLLMVSFQPRRSNEAFPATLPLADMVSLIVVS